MEEGQDCAAGCSSGCCGEETSTTCKEERPCKNDSCHQLNTALPSLRKDARGDGCCIDGLVSSLNEMTMPSTQQATAGCKLNDGHRELRKTSYRSLMGNSTLSNGNICLDTDSEDGNSVPNNHEATVILGLKRQDAMEAKPSIESAPSTESDAIELELQPSKVETQPQPSGKVTDKDPVRAVVDVPERKDHPEQHERTLETKSKALQNGPGSDSHTQSQAQDVETALDEIVTALDSFTALDNNQLSFKRGDQIHVISKNSEEWWWGELNGCYGYLPVNHVSPKTLEELESELWQDEEYFGSYSSLKLQLEMLNDKPRTLAYRTAIERNADFLKDKVIMDLGCGTGILSLFCARYGRPNKIYAVEASRMADKAKKLMLYNGYWDVVKVVHDRVENISLPEKVDLIISEWMGTLLLFELMVESVLIARDKFLAKGGVMWPSHAKLYLAPCRAQAQFDEKIACWEDQYGFDFSPLIPSAKKEFFGRPIFNHELDLQDCLAEWETVLVMDMKRFRVEELEEISQDFEFQVTREGTFHGFASWFSVDFGGFPSTEPPVVLNTGPEHEMTHWKQDLFMMDQPTAVEGGDSIVGSILIKRNPEWRRHLRVRFTWEVLKAGVRWGTQKQKQFLLWR
ncbi:protein arginine N-methyltransferase 2-like isoform X2 [Branchiostoma lanceolatum]|uniref:protein arginine N-methyltransferase 2-like isoform X2 n=1 Tax=Branchiostoma lanceolatum TaxID=7740 RepID=UPI00345729A2